ncbi:MAG TPA: hypothetical protein VFW53_12020 [Gallionella sp.]|nr:hypothetical protein [Gallionella sp.]
MFDNLEISNRLSVAFGSAIGIVMAVMLALGFLLGQVKKAPEQNKDASLPFILQIDEMSLSVSQVQQFMTDVSATHNRDGYREAEAAAQRFLAGIARFKEMFREEGNSAALRQVEALEKRFRMFYAMGKEMSEVYVSRGLDAGNAMMEKFDRESSALGASLMVLREQHMAGEHSATKVASSMPVKHSRI